MGRSARRLLSAPSPAPTPTHSGNCNAWRRSCTPPSPIWNKSWPTRTRKGLARLDEDGDLIVSPLPAEQVPAEVDALAQAVAARLAQIHLPALLIKVDRDTRFTEAFTHAGGAQPRNPELVRNLYASVLAYAYNLGYAGMADASGISEDTLVWTSQWYLRQDTLREANARLVNAHHQHPLTRLWGGGTLSSSDGQRFPQRGPSLTARTLSRYFLDEGTTTYKHV